MREASIIVAASFVALYSYCSVHQQKNEEVATVVYYRVHSVDLAVGEEPARNRPNTEQL